MKELIPTIDAYRLFHKGQIALAEIEANGIRIDEAHLEQAVASIDRKAAKLQKRLHDNPLWARWRREFGAKASIGSPVQLGKIVFDVLGHKSKNTTPTGRPKTDEAAFEGVKLPFVKRYFRLKKLKNAKTTFLGGIKGETVKGYVHAFYNLNMAATFRSSADTPNLQNQPARDPKMAETIRRCFIPRPGRRIIENDFSALEFKIAACFWKDPKMIAYASNPNKDIHRDMAAKIFDCDKNQVSKAMRFTAKNDFVFATLYGSYYVHTSEHLWNDILKNQLTLLDGTPVKDHLAYKGITEPGRFDKDQRPEPGTFEAHVKTVEDWFMGKFQTFAEGKERWYDEYRKKAGFRLMTGFVVKGLYSKNDCLNYPIQGPGFHCLLWTLIRLLKKIKRRQMKSLVVGQIHDCALGDVPDAEVQDYLHMVKRIVSVELPRAWPWIIVPLEIEAEVTPLAEEGGTWWSKRQWIEQDGVWGPKE